MNGFERLFLLALFFWGGAFSSAVHGDTFYGAHKIIYLSNVIENTDEPDKWINLGNFSMNTPSGSDNIPITSSYPCADYFCTGGRTELGLSGKSSYITYLTRIPVTISDVAGNQYIFSVAFPYGLPEVYLSEYNITSGRTIHTKSDISGAVDFTQPSNVQNALSSHMKSKLNNCGNLYGCTIKGAAWIKGSASPAIYIKLPKNLSAQTLSFNEQTILRLKTHISKQSMIDTVETPYVELKISGSITIPERCFFKVDSESFHFNSIFSNADNGLKGQKNINVTTTCNYAPEGTKQYMKMTAISGGSLNADNNYYEVGNSVTTNKALGIIFKIDGTISGCDSNGDVFEQEYLTNTFSYGLNKTYSTPINFYLCKYGMPEKTGEQSIILRLTSRWVIE
ncbi:hypothetical protein H1A28_23160 [Escherichia coli]|uniref:hypothetical protein n=1 Tax=Escherichia coli TaxID=562 RepID=UPI0017AAD227|nr:hypothetical protein [Escherichia coli]MBA2207354.1 hypothetical protein [Escherichia coli]